MDNLNNLFNYLDAEQIHLDKDEFDFQFNSHPDYPSLLALSDPLSFLISTTGSLKLVGLILDSSQINSLPN